jgi:Kef-type K+ transport system membrane component KefB
VYYVVQESSHKGPFSDLLLSIVAVDDAWALLLFSIGLALVASMAGEASHSEILFVAVREIGGAVFLGCGIGLPAAYMTGRIKPGEPVLSEALGLVFLCGGLAIWLEVSFLIAAMVMGMVVANFARHHEYPFHAIENIEFPFMVIFFVLAGANLDISMVVQLGSIGLAYILARIAGKISGAWLGAVMSKADPCTRKWMGLALLPQAGVAIGMALVASNYFPQYQQIVLSITISSTVFFEIIGPVFTRIALKRSEDGRRP